MNLKSRFERELRISRSLYRIVGIERIHDLRDEVERQQARHVGTPEQNYFADTAYDFGILDQSDVRSVFIVATPSPFYILRIEGLIDLRIPPVYGNRDAILAESRRITEAVFPEFDCRTQPVVLPKKALAVHCGLARYGNNGIAYIKEFGSYFRLTVFASDYVPPEKSEWHESRLMDSCASCGKCVALCPVGALRAGTAWVDTNRCLTRFNEQPGDFPEWIGLDSHGSLVGCSICQEGCPHNHKKAQKIVIEMPAESLRQLLDAADLTKLDGDTRTVLDDLCLERYFPVLKRNFGMLMEKNARGRKKLKES